MLVRCLFCADLTSEKLEYIHLYIHHSPYYLPTGITVTLCCAIALHTVCNRTICGKHWFYDFLFGSFSLLSIPPTCMIEFRYGGYSGND